MASGFEIRHDNDAAGLRWIHIFGWLRSAELGPLLWPGQQYARTQADRVIRGWRERRLVIERRLPDGAGRAVVLSDAGARLLHEVGVEDARSGKDWGETDGDRWRPDNAWKHDLIAAGVLIQLRNRGCEILPEKQLRRENPALIKIPDGLAWNANMVFWVEVENARKSGPALNHLAEALCAVAGGTCGLVSGKQPTMPLVAYVKGAKDERGLRLNHQERVANALRKIAKTDARLVWAACELMGNGVAAMTVDGPEQIEADPVSQILKRLDANGWRLDEFDLLVANYGKLQAVVWYAKAEMGGWCYRLEGPDVSMSAIAAANKTAAKRGCAQLLASRKPVAM